MYKVMSVAAFGGVIRAKSELNAHLVRRYIDNDNDLRMAGWPSTPSDLLCGASIIKPMKGFLLRWFEAGQI